MGKRNAAALRAIAASVGPKNCQRQNAVSISGGFSRFRSARVGGRRLAASRFEGTVSTVGDYRSGSDVKHCDENKKFFGHFGNAGFIWAIAFNSSAIALAVISIDPCKFLGRSGS